MKLNQLLERMEARILTGSGETEVSHLVYDSRKVQKGDLFVCIRGALSDGHQYIPQVLEQGAASLVVMEDAAESYLEECTKRNVTLVAAKDTRHALACLSAAYFGYPAEQLKTIGITGTKGKTTTTYMVRSILEESGIKTGLIGTIETIIGEKKTPASNTTPESYLVQQSFREMVDAGCKAVVMEVSSQGLMLHRVSGFTFDYGIFTNLEPDHIGPNEHKDMEEYISCKGLLFKQCRIGIVNIDDMHTAKVLDGHTCTVETFGFDEKADLRAENVALLKMPGYLGVSYDTQGLFNRHVEIGIPGQFSVYNSLTAIAICRHFGVSEEGIIHALQDVKVKGRVELVKVSDRYTMMIDYAHNAMSLESLLTTLKAYEPKRLVCLFGCGGDRSKLRRYEMGEISSKFADLTVVTSDNPRTEEPMAIIEDILTGVKKADGAFVTIPDRKEAIRYCIEHAEDGDVIVLAGKGHEDYQEINGKKYHMDEREIIWEILESSSAIQN